ncbi:hypothetical protein ACFTRD_30260 [Paenibacillus sp. NPDC056933]|uniref:hypothetical protein n=1 Tax=Paenibacillus sp. NPDC056933 TaxID=3345968 RepID=UPI0036447BE5
MNQSKDTYTIGEAAKMIGSTVKTIRSPILKPPATGDSSLNFEKQKKHSLHNTGSPEGFQCVQGMHV